MEWQPIETAPKDGTPILIYCSDLGDERYSGAAITTVVWEGTWSLCQCGTYAEDGDLFGTPSHWMPLPNPPESA